MQEKLAWGIIGTGNIARTFAEALATSATGHLLAVGSRAQETADRFGAAHDVSRCYGSYDALLADPEVEAVYISTPHPQHAEVAINAAKAGKHILCEKPLAMNHGEALAIIDAARENNVFMMEAFMYRCHPQTEKIIELIRAGAIGEVRVIQATFSFSGDFSAESRVLSKALGGGGIMDVGCYCVSMARLIAGAATGRDFAEPLEVIGMAHLGKTGVDEYATALMRFPNDIIAELATGVQLNQENVVRIFGTQGSLFIPSPWIPAPKGGATKIVLQKYGIAELQEIIIDTPEGLYAIEADVAARNIERRQAPSPAMNWDDSLGNALALDRWRASIGLKFDTD